MDVRIGELDRRLTDRIDSLGQRLEVLTDQVGRLTEGLTKLENLLTVGFTDIKEGFREMREQSKKRDGQIDRLLSLLERVISEKGK